MKQFLKIRFAAVMLAATLCITTVNNSCAVLECVLQEIAELFGDILTDDLPEKLIAGEAYLFPTLIKNSFDALDEIGECFELGPAEVSTTRMRMEYDDGTGYRLATSEEFEVVGNGRVYSGEVSFTEPPFDPSESRRYNDTFRFNKAGWYRVTEYFDDERDVEEANEDNNVASCNTRPQPRSAASNTAYSLEVEVVYANPEDEQRLSHLPAAQFKFDSGRQIKQ